MRLDRGTVCPDPEGLVKSWSRSVSVKHAILYRTRGEGKVLHGIFGLRISLESSGHKETQIKRSTVLHIISDGRVYQFGDVLSRAAPPTIDLHPDAWVERLAGDTRG